MKIGKRRCHIVRVPDTNRTLRAYRRYRKCHRNPMIAAAVNFSTGQ